MEHIIKEIDDNMISYRGKTYLKQMEKRGRRFKFWLNEDFLFKANLHNDACENIGEVVSYLIAEELGMEAVPYKLAKFIDRDGNETKGVICPNFRKMYDEEIDELSGNLLINICKMYQGFGKIKTPSNTVDFYTKMISILYPKSDLKELRISMLKMALYDYIINQRDRHSGNITFLKVGDRVELCPIYDNGAAYWSNYGSKKITNISLAINATRNKNTLYFDTLKGYTMFGITKPQSKTMLNDNGQLVEGHIDDASYIDFEKEMAKEILKNIELADFYQKICELDINNITEKAEDEDCELTDEHKSIMKDVHDFKIERMERAIVNERGHMFVQDVVVGNDKGGIETYEQ